MENNNELSNFKVEELEQRLEMKKAKWASTSEYACTSGDCRGYIGVSRTF